MCPSTDSSPEQIAAAILLQLLHRIEVGNANAAADPRPGRYTFLVSHAWTDGASIRIVYTAPPSDRTWGLARDTRQSLINPSAWNEGDDAALYYYLLDLEENWPGHSAREPGEDPYLIWWQGHPLEDLPQYTSTLFEGHRYTPPTPDPSWIDHSVPVVNEPRRYADPNGPLSRGVGGSGE